MKKSTLNAPRDYLALLVRRSAWILAIFATLSLALALLTHILPRMFVSETLILIQPRDVPEDFVKDLIAGTTEQRLTAIEQTVLSRTNLVQILNQFEDGLPEYRSPNMDEKVLKLRNQIRIAFESERRMGVQLPVTYFRISYMNQNPELAQKICSRLTSLFIEQYNRTRETQVFGTTEFLATELEKVGEQLRQSDTRLKQLKERRRYELPDQLETNLRTLDRLNLQKQANAEALDRYATIRLNLERQISETPAVISKESLNLRGVSQKLGRNPLVDELKKKELEYQEISARYTSRHPDVLRARAEIQRLRKQIPPEDLVEADKQAGPEITSVMVPNPVHQSLTAQLREVKTEFGIREKEKKWIETEIEKYIQRVQNAPRSEQEIASVLRLNTDLTKQHEGLKNKLAAAKLSESLESRQKGSQFVVLDPANYPLLPTKPNKPAVILVGMAIILGVSVGTGFVVDFTNQKIWTQAEIEHLFNVPVLVEIPEIVTQADLSLAKRKRIVYALASLFLGGLYAGGLYLVYLKQAHVLNKLEPIIQKLMY